MDGDGAAGLAQVCVPDTADGPPDLHAFWATTMAQLGQIPVELRLSPRPALDNNVLAHDLSFR
jgi:hypothetical protein